ncbi:MAG: replicative DNA helicase [Proteobacteria bacterium]|nr:replicative DNA helicase [Pseudomonadota bacterium]
MTEPAPRSNVAPLKTRDDGAAPLRIPPHNFEAEMALLGALLANNRAYDKVSEILLPEHFADDRHGRIYEACGKLIQRGQIANPITLKNYFEQATAENSSGSLAEIGGPAYLSRLTSAVVTIINAVDYAKSIRDLYLRRELIALGEDVVNRAFGFDLETGAREQIETAEQGLFNLATQGDSEGGFRAFASALNAAIDIAQAAYKRDSHVTGVTTGLIDLDKMLGGLHPSDLVICAARPSMGKTALATNIAFNAAGAYKEKRTEDGTVEVVEGAKVAFFSLEMSSEQLATRLLSEQTEIASDKIRRGDVRGEDFPKFVEVSKRLAQLPLFIDDTPSLSISQIRTRARRLMRTHGLGLIVIDYLQLASAPAGMKVENRVLEISAITRGLKALAKELNVPVLACAQLSRAVEQREDKRPLLSDLRESGTIEQDADVVMFIYREQYYHERAEPMRRPDESDEKYLDRHAKWQERGEEIHNVAEVIIGKQRHGPVGSVKLFFDGTYTKFDDLGDANQQPDDGAR